MPTIHQKYMKRFIAVSVLPLICVFAVFATAVYAQAIPTYSSWDASLPDIMLRKVDTTTGSLKAQFRQFELHAVRSTGAPEEIAEVERKMAELNPMPLVAEEVWQTFSSNYGIRSVLFLEDTMDTHKPMEFYCDECLVRDLFDAFAATYGLAWQVDPNTGVHWFFPDYKNYEDVLATKIEIEDDYYGMLMSSGVLRGLYVQFEDYDEYRLFPHHYSPIFRGDQTFDFHVNIPAGQHTIRDILNYACLGYPATSFFVGCRNMQTEIIPVRITPFMGEPGRGLGAFKNAELEEFDRSYSVMQNILARLSSESARMRWATTSYIQFASVSYYDWAKTPDYNIKETEELAWLFVATLSNDGRYGYAPVLKSLAPRFSEKITPEFLRKCRIDLAILASLELARVLDDVEGVKVVTQRELPQEILEDIISDAARIARLSDTAWEALMNTEWGFASVAPEWVQRITHGKEERQTQLAFTIVPPGEAPPAPMAALVESDETAAPAAEALPSQTAIPSPAVAPDTPSPIEPASAPAPAATTRIRPLLLGIAAVALVVLLLCVVRRRNAAQSDGSE